MREPHLLPLLHMQQEAWQTKHLVPLQGQGSWGLLLPLGPDLEWLASLPAVQTQRVTLYAKSLDASRLFDCASGWFDADVGDLHDMHMYVGPGGCCSSLPLVDFRAAGQVCAVSTPVCLNKDNDALVAAAALPRRRVLSAHLLP